MSKVLMKGNEAVAKAAIMAGCTCFFGYPITPQSEIPEYMSRELPKVGGHFVQAESEISAINMVYGAAGAGARVMTSSSSPGIALKQEGISYLAGAELPCLVVNMMRAGPGLGGIQPAQGDYFQSTRGGGNGDYYMPVYAPSTVQEMVDLTYHAYDVADKYRSPVMIVADGMIGQMMEPCEFKERSEHRVEKPWATTGTKGKRKPNEITSLYLEPEGLEEHVDRLFVKFEEMKKHEVMVEEYMCEDAELVIVAYGTVARISKNAIAELREQGVKAGLLRPITIWPYPYASVANLPKSVKNILVVEMSKGQMIEDVMLGSKGKHKIFFHGRSGGMTPTPEEIVEVANDIKGGKANEYSL